MKQSVTLLLSTLLYSQLATAVFLTSEGKAPIRHNDLSTARYLAILDAMNQASLENGAQVTSDTIMNNLTIRADTVRVRTRGKVGQVHMLHEWDEDGVYYVRISADVNDNPLNCGAPNALVHNKRIGVVQFTNQVLQDSSDLRNPEQGLAQMVVDGINRTHALQAVNLSHFAIDRNNGLEDPEQIRQLARQSGVQYILVGELLQARRDQTGDLAESGLMKRFSNLIRLGEEWSQQRYLEIATLLYDGDSGELVTRTGSSGTAKGEGYVGRNLPVGSHGFLQTPTGSEFQRLIGTQVEQLTATLSCEPMVTPIAAIDGNVITLPVGRNSGIHAGDRLIVVELGNPLNILATLQITQVSATRSSGMTDIDAAVLGITVNDQVRSW